MTRTLRSLIAAVLLCLGLSSCSSHDWSQDEANLNMIKIHAIVPDNMPKSDLVIVMPTMNNNTVKMDRIPLLSSKEMVHAESDFVGEGAMYIKIDLTSLHSIKTNFKTDSYVLILHTILIKHMLCQNLHYFKDVSNW